MSANQAPTILALIASVAVTSWLYAAFYLANSPALAAKRGKTEPGKVDPGSGLAPGPTTFVATSANPAIWAQSFQLIQVVHLLWPPFLLGYRYRAQYRLIRRQMDSLLINLPHASE